MQALNIPFGDHVLRGDVLAAPQGRSTVLLLHGGGSSTGEGFAELRAFLHARQVDTVAFDFVGHGRTGGPQLGSTLAQRVAQVLAVVQALGLDPARLTLAGFSMGAYVAACAAERLAPAGLCLAIPAAYAPEALEQPFGPAFSTVLRRPRSWAGSDAFAHVAQFAGHLLVLSAEHDAVVPVEIPHTYHACAVRARSREHHVVAGSGHDLSTHYAAQPGARELAYEAIARLCGQVAAAGPCPAVTLRPMTDADIPMLHDWLNRPHIVRWWGGEAQRPSLEETWADYRPAVLTAENVTPYIGLLDGRPFAYAQSYVAMGSGDGWWPDETDPGMRGIDQSIAEPELLGRGLGTLLVKALVARLFDDPAVTQVQTDPAPDNARAIRCYEKAGFRRVGEVTTPDGPAVYMLQQRPGGGVSPPPPR